MDFRGTILCRASQQAGRPSPQFALRGSMKIDITRIIIAQVRTLRDNATQRYSVPDLILFFGLPIALGAGGAYYGWKFDADVLNALLAAFVIFAGLLLNLLVLVYMFSASTEHPAALAQNGTTLIKELHDNIAYAILESIVIVVMTMITVAYLKMREQPPADAFTVKWVSAVIIFLTMNFVLTLLMILKRMYIMLNQIIEKPFIRKKTA